jgi:hypothetical protein
VSHELVIIDTVSGLAEAEILRGLLESAGVNVELSYEAALSAYSVGVGRLARVELMVRGDQETLARQVLEDYRSGALDVPGAPTDGPAD